MKAYQLKIAIKNSHPPIWRRCIIPHGLTFSQLSVILNIIMGWSGYHLSDFTFNQQRLIFDENPEPDEMPFWGFNVLPANQAYIDKYLENEAWFTYMYDYGDEWAHRVTVEKVLTDYDQDYPAVIKYKGDCPPEDCGGISDYTAFLNGTLDDADFDFDKRYPGDVDSYDLTEVNDELAKTCILNPHTVEKRNSREIYADFEQSKYGLNSKFSKRKITNVKIDAEEKWKKILSAFQQNIEQIALTEQEPSLEESLKGFDKASLKSIAQEREIPYKSGDTKNTLIKKILSVISSDKVMEAYFLAMDDEEMNNFKKILKLHGEPHCLTAADFPILSTGLYADFSANFGVSIPKEVKDAFNRIVKGDFQKRRRRRLWLLQCMNVANLLYGIAPIDILAKLVNRNKKYKTNTQDLLAEIQSIPCELMMGKIHGDTFYAAGLWPDDKDLLAVQGDKPFYIPTAEEIQTFFDDSFSHSPYVNEVTALLRQATGADEEELSHLVLMIQSQFISDLPISEVIHFLEAQELNFRNENKLNSLLQALANLSNHTRKITNRGYMPIELAPPKPTSNLIQVKNWRKGH